MSHRKNPTDDQIKTAQADTRKRVDAYEIIPPDKRGGHLHNSSGNDIRQLIVDIKLLMSTIELSTNKTPEDIKRWNSLKELLGPIETKYQEFKNSQITAQANVERMQKELAEQRKAYEALSPEDKQRQNDYSAYMSMAREAEIIKNGGKGDASIMNRLGPFLSSLSEQKIDFLIQDITRREKDKAPRFLGPVLEKQKEMQITQKSGADTLAKPVSKEESVSPGQSPPVKRPKLGGGD